MSMNIYQRLHAVMQEVGYVQKDTGFSSRPNDKGVARDAVVAEIRPVLLKHGVVASTTQVGPGRYIENAQKSSSGTPLSIYCGTYRTVFTCIDDPSSTHIVEHEAEGRDYGDKAPGKAATYGEKLNFVKGLMLETGIADEGRNSGEGDEPGPENAGIKTPQKKAPAAESKPTAAEPKAEAGDGEKASPGLLKQVKNKAEAKGLTAQVEKNLAAKGTSWDALTKTQAATIQKWIDDQPDE